MNDSTGSHSRVPLFLLLTVLTVGCICVCGVAVGAGILLVLSRPTPNPTAGTAIRPSSTRTPTVVTAAGPLSITDTPTLEAADPTPADGMESDPDSWRTMGDSDAPVRIEEFGDFQCPYCGTFYDQSEKRLREEYIDSGKVRFVFRNYIVVDSFVPGGNESRGAAMGALCAGEQGKFWEYHDQLFERQSGENAGAFAVPNLLAFAFDLELQADSFAQCLEDEPYAYLLQADKEAARLNGIDGVPAFLINGDVMIGFTGGDFFDAIDEALADAGL
jgi:protein-disulfide isomerase